MFNGVRIAPNFIEMIEIVVTDATVASVTSRRIQQQVIVRIPEGLFSNDNQQQQDF